MTKTEQLQQDLDYIATAVRRRDRPIGIPAIYFLWAAIIGIGFALPDFAPRSLNGFWLVAGIGGGLLSWWLGERESRRSGVNDAELGRRYGLHWGIGGIAFLLMKQPDFGSTIIFGCVWIAMLALAGVSMRMLVGLAIVAIVGVVLAYFFYDVATARIDGFLFGEGDTFQTDNAMRTLTAGGLFGMGPGGGTRKFGLPEPHTDYIFSVIGEEFGLIACLAIAGVGLGIVARVLIKLLDEANSFSILAAAGLAVEFGLQALINMMVNVQLAPSKGMTLPFISYGGSSMLALSIGMGLLLAFTRRNPYLTRSPYVVKWSGESLTT
jgi:cell division protein FtsW